jgi:HEAT repeat protein
MRDAQWELEHVRPVLAEREWELRHEVEAQLHEAHVEMTTAVEAMAPVAREAMERGLVEATRAMEHADVAQLAAVEVEAAMAAMTWDAPARAPRAGPERFRTTAPESWAGQDPADSLYRIAREALNRNDYRRAATLFQQLAARYPRSAYAADAAYYEAFARYRVRTEPELRQALRVLEARLARNVSSATSADAAALATRIRGELGSWAQGDAARRLTGQLAETARSGDGCDREEAAVRIEALNALAKIDSAAVLPSVRRVLANQATCAASLRQRAVYLLGRSSAPDAEALLIQTARADSSTGVRAAALSSLARNPSDRALAAIEEILRTSQDERTQSAAMSALARSEHPRGRQAVRALAERPDASTRMRATAIAELSRDTAAATGAWLRGLYGRVDSLRLKESIVSAIGRQRSAENDQWLAALARNTNEPMRIRRQALGYYARPDLSPARRQVAITELVRLYDGVPEMELRDALISAFMQRTEPEATDKLIAIARSDADSRLRRSAIASLARKDDPRTVRLLTEIIDKTP